MLQKEALKSAKAAVKDLILSKHCNPIIVRLAWHDSGSYDAVGHFAAVLPGDSDISKPTKYLWRQIPSAHIACSCNFASSALMWRAP